MYYWEGREGENLVNKWRAHERVTFDVSHNYCTAVVSLHCLAIQKLLFKTLTPYTSLL